MHNKESQEFDVGSQVIYGVHGKCKILGVETKKVGGQNLRFYKLEKIKAGPIKRADPHETAIWLPVDSAAQKGLRAPMTSEEAKQVMEILSGPETYFSFEEPWQKAHAELEKTILSEGPLGLAKVWSYLYVMMQGPPVPPPMAEKYADTIQKQLIRELADAFGDSIRVTEEKVERAVRQKAP